MTSQNACKRRSSFLSLVPLLPKPFSQKRNVCIWQASLVFACPTRPALSSKPARLPGQPSRFTGRPGRRWQRWPVRPREVSEIQHCKGKKKRERKRKEQSSSFSPWKKRMEVGRTDGLHVGRTPNEPRWENHAIVRPAMNIRTSVCTRLINCTY